MAAVTFEDSFRGKYVLVTGAGRGIGRELCKRLDELGCKVYALSRTRSTLESLQQERPNINVICADISDWQATEAKLQKLEVMDFLVNNAAVMVYGNFLDMTSESMEQAVQTNLISTIQISQLVAKKMIEKGTGGSIVNVSSIASKVVGHGCVPYSLTKAALDMLTKTMAYELGPHQIRVNSVNPGVVLTDMGKDLLSHQPNIQEATAMFMARCPMKRSPTELEVANTILILLSNYSSMTTGETLLIDGGQMTN